MNRYAKLNAPTVAFAGFLMLLYAFMGGGWVYPADANEFYVFTLSAFDWLLRIGGAAMLIVAAICYTGARIGLLLEVIVSGLCGLTMWMCAGTWLMNGSVGINTILICVFGFLFLSAARSAWTMYRAGEGTTKPRVAAQPAAPVAPPPPHPASQASSVLPKDGEPPPEEGYLAALSKEED